MATKRTAEEDDRIDPQVAYVDNLVKRMRQKADWMISIVKERGLQNNYGDALAPDGGVLNQFEMCSRKFHRLRGQIRNPILNNTPINAGYEDTIPDLMNYLMFLWLMLEDEAPLT